VTLDVPLTAPGKLVMFAHDTGVRVDVSSSKRLVSAEAQLTIAFESVCCMFRCGTATRTLRVSSAEGANVEMSSLPTPGGSERSKMSELFGVVATSKMPFVTFKITGSLKDCNGKPAVQVWAYEPTCTNGLNAIAVPDQSKAISRYPGNCGLLLPPMPKLPNPISKPPVAEIADKSTVMLHVPEPLAPTVGASDGVNATPSK
jgi:hypothetical protein